MLTSIRSTMNALTAFAAVAALAWLVAAGGSLAASAAQATPTAAPSVVANSGADEALARLTDEDGVLRFDVAEDMTRFVFADEPVDDNGMPAHGNPFITQGYIYPAGTLTESNGVNADGSPEFPEQVLGQWTCRGWVVGDGLQTGTGPMVITTQVYNFGAEYGDAMLVSEGYELADVGVAIERAITGGTGPFAAAGGAGEQTFLGMNASEGVNLQIALAPQGV
jgi:hypothetical protein